MNGPIHCLLFVVLSLMSLLYSFKLACCCSFIAQAMLHYGIIGCILFCLSLLSYSADGPCWNHRCLVQGAACKLSESYCWRCTLPARLMRLRVQKVEATFMKKQNGFPNTVVVMCGEVSACRWTLSCWCPLLTVSDNLGHVPRGAMTPGIQLVYGQKSMLQGIPHHHTLPPWGCF